MCFHMYIHVGVHAFVYVHFCNTPPQVLKLALPLPLPSPYIEKLPTPMSQSGILGKPFEAPLRLRLISSFPVNIFFFGGGEGACLGSQ